MSDGPAVKRVPFTSIFDFCERVPPGAVNKATIEALVKSGAFDAVHGRDHRAALVGSIDQAVSAGQKVAADKAAGQGALFGFGGDDTPSTPAAELPLARVPAWSEAEMLAQEKETLGFYVSSHPLVAWEAWARTFTGLTTEKLKDEPTDKRVILPALVASVRTIVARNGRSAGQKMAILTVEDLTGQAEAVLFPGVYAQFGHLAEEGKAAFVLGRVDRGRGDAQIVVDRLVPIDGCPLEKGRVRVMVRADRVNGSGPAVLAKVADLIESQPAPTGLEDHGERPRPVELVVETDQAWITLEPKRAKSVRLEPGLVRDLTGALGEGSVLLTGGVSVELNRDDQRRKYASRA